MLPSGPAAACPNCTALPAPMERAAGAVPAASWPPRAMPIRPKSPHRHAWMQACLRDVGLLQDFFVGHLHCDCANKYQNPHCSRKTDRLSHFAQVFQPRCRPASLTGGVAAPARLHWQLPLRSPRPNKREAHYTQRAGIIVVWRRHCKGGQTTFLHFALVQGLGWFATVGYEKHGRRPG